jgi:hypothetical protein
MAQKVFTSTTLTSADVNLYLAGEGGAWTSYTPNIVQSATVDSTWSWSRYARFGRLIIWSFGGGATAAGSAGNAITVSLPVVAAAGANIVIGAGNITDISGGASGSYNGNWKMSSTTRIGLLRDVQTSFVGGAPSFALANGDTLEGFVVYEAAS